MRKLYLASESCRLSALRLLSERNTVTVHTLYATNNVTAKHPAFDERLSVGILRLRLLYNEVFTGRKAGRIALSTRVYDPPFDIQRYEVFQLSLIHI